MEQPSDTDISPPQGEQWVAIHARLFGLALGDDDYPPLGATADWIAGALRDSRDPIPPDPAFPATPPGRGSP